ncbi:carbohydrate binding family 9 domain-containing protein [Hymenobacter latericus]|uniref:carbohydrate binding family 9 domain-containing protein n=1 Tax=Hymenobacter sp. YIM 151858-1 TaxID=2987688 RepID=UPI002227F152|nr:carbohydrate binding family 9 domain-containing protein [Hymenobacter sp. YIM 151858-1]UYZ59169.1 carbohydrate binding family 9 domain-containing protein [Hymenobacter sp. YIM 151858-1]
MLTRTLLVLLFGLWMRSAWAQAPAPPVAKPGKQLQALRIAEPVKLDGQLDEPAWQQAPVATDFVENQPTPGRPEKHKTEVRVLYDNQHLYIGAVMHDISPDSILRELSQRDDINNSDWFGVFLDTYHDKQNGYGFIVTSGGVQLDARYSPANGEDGNWNAVWDSRTAIRGTDWVAELRIPYSAIRFAPATGGVAPVWGLNFARQRQITRQKFFWNELRPEVDGFVNQWGTLHDLRDIKPPLRLSLTPYVSGYVNDNPLNAEGQRRTTTAFNGGADVKWGINESFTLDATLVPDFGQVQSDNQVLNLSPFEVQFAENRQFFTEGTELFNKGNLFYSRRVGATPIGFYQVQAGENEKIIRNPAETRLLNATKVSGRTRKGLGIGVFNALSNDVYATVRNEETGQERTVKTQPFSNYNITVLDQSLKNNSYVSLINTNVTRWGQTYDANVTGGLFRFANKSNSYAVDGRVVYSRRRGNRFGSDEQIDDRDGFKYSLGVGKISGAFTWNLSHGIESDRYNPNDLGILFGNNKISQELQLRYNKFKPFWKVNNLSTYLGTYYGLLFSPTRYQAVNVYGGANTTFTKHFISTGFYFELYPVTRDYFEPRQYPLGRYFVRRPANAVVGGYVSSDYRKKLAVDLNANLVPYAEDDRLPRPRRLDVSFGLSPRYRVNNQLNFRYSVNWSLNHNQIGYVNGGMSSSEPLDQDFLGQVILGRRNVVTVSNVLQTAYTFTNRMSLTVRTRHYTSNVRYRDFARLSPGGDEELVDYRRNRDNTYNAFNIDAVYSWWFAPGSQVSVVWKNAGSTFLQAEQATPLYFDNLSNTINTPHNNSISIKVLYFLDYLALRPKRG